MKICQSVFSSTLSVCVAAAMSPLAFMAMPLQAQAATAAPSIDGDLSDWESVEEITGTTSPFEGMKLCKDADGNVYLALYGTVSTQWDTGGFQWTYIAVGNNGNKSGAQPGNATYSGWDVQYVCEANGNTAGPMYMEIMIPASYFSSDDYNITAGGVTVPGTSIPEYVEPAADDTPAVYEGITIDGKFSDWDAVERYDAGCDNTAHLNCITECAMVFDGDEVYIYIKEAPGQSAAGAGSHGNGRYSITTDLGRTITFTLNNDGSVSGIAGAEANHVGSQWEISIPKSELPQYLETIDFGLYLTEPFITDVANLDGSSNEDTFDGVVIDGSFGDWETYPHTEIEYATAGTQENTADSEGALYSKDGMLYAHVVTTMDAHTQNESGGEFLAAVSIAFNNDRDYKEYPSDGNFYPKFFAVDENGTITVVNEGTHLENGTYTFYIGDTRTALSSDNFADLDASEVFGTMMVTIKDGCDEMEFEVDLEKVAAYIGVDADSFKQIDGQWGRLGQQWITTAGTSTWPFVGIGICIAAVAGVLGWRRYKSTKTAKEGASVS